MDESIYLARIAAASADGNEAELGRLADELQGQAGGLAGTLRMKAIAAKVAIKRSKAGGASPPRPAGSGRPPGPPRPTWLDLCGIGQIDGRSLYRYNLSDEHFDRLESDLRSRAHNLQVGAKGELAGQFVLWAAEWFRRCYDGSGQRWEALGNAVGVRREWACWAFLTDTGLKFWRLDPLVLNGTRHRLAALARQGGFPCQAIERETGWPQRFLERLVAEVAALEQVEFAAAQVIAERRIALVPDLWNSLELRVVAAELAVEIVQLRRRAEDNGVPSGALASAWLDQNEPGWRENLPLAMNSDAARLLLDGLFKVVTLKVAGDAVRCRRWVEIGTDGRREGVEIDLKGRLIDGSGKLLTRTLGEEWSRLRLYGSSSFAQHVVGELAVVEPDEEGVWIARPSTRRSRFELPSNVPVSAELRGDGQRVAGPFQIAGGEAVRSELRVHVREDTGNSGARLQLVQIGTGSGSHREEELYLETPSGWSVVGHSEGTRCEQLSGGTGERQYHFLVGDALVSTPRNDRYLVRSGQRSFTRDKVLISGNEAHDRTPPDEGRPYLLGEPLVLVRERRTERAPQRHEIWWRPAGQREWRAGSKAGVFGPCEYAWRDGVLGHIRDRVDVILLPGDFSATARRVGDWHEVRVAGWHGTITASAGTPHGEACWRLPAKGDVRSHILLTLHGAPGGDFYIYVRLRHQSWIESWDKGPTLRNAQLSLSTINRFVARSDGRCELLADLIDRDGRPVPQGRTSWWVESELPLSAIRDDLAALLRPGGDIRAKVRLNFNDGHEDHWFVEEFEHQLRREGVGLLPAPAIVEEADVIARPLADPVREQSLGTIGLAMGSNHRPFVLPTHKGDWLVYLRSGDRVLSSPCVHGGGPLLDTPQTPLGKVMSISDRHDRLAALGQLAETMLANPLADTSRRFVRQLIELGLSLRGLPPGTFDALSLLCDHRILGPLMLFQAREEEIEQLLRLSEGLPFAWWQSSVDDWTRAAHAQADFLYGKLPGSHLLIASAISRTRGAIAALDPVLAPLLEQPGCPPSLQAAANAFLNRADDRIVTSERNPFRPGRSEALPAWPVDEGFWRALDAPVVAARTLKGAPPLNAAELRCAKDIARQHPRWFREGFAAALKEL